jgi:transposase-like protein
MSKKQLHEAGASEGARRATGEASASSALVGRGRWSARRKVSVVLELLRGADLESVSRRHGVTAAKLSQWRDEFLAGGEARLKHREEAVEDEDTRRLKSVVADLATDKALLVEKIRHLEAGRPLGWWRSKR